MTDHHCVDAWHAATSILHEQCPTCGGEWKHGEGLGLGAALVDGALDALEDALEDDDDHETGGGD